MGVVLVDKGYGSNVVSCACHNTADTLSMA